jgi:hypothetical protein
MLRWPQRSLAAFAVVWTTTLSAQTVQDDTAPDPNTMYAPSPAYPFGRPHPDAPPKLEQFAFMVGEFDCVDEIRQRDGTRLRFQSSRTVGSRLPPRRPTAQL